MKARLIGTVLLLIGSGGTGAEEPVPPASVPLPPALDKVCFYAGKLYSIGAEAQFNGSVFVCTRVEAELTRWERLFTPSARTLANRRRPQR